MVLLYNTETILAPAGISWLSSLQRSYYILIDLAKFNGLHYKCIQSFRREIIGADTMCQGLT